MEGETVPFTQENNATQQNLSADLLQSTKHVIEILQQGFSFDFHCFQTFIAREKTLGFFLNLSS